MAGKKPVSRGKKTSPPATKDKATDNAVFQFKITLTGIDPPIWRRIQTADCTLDQLHEHIQTAMGWTNSHLHQFEIDGECYGDPELLNDDFECIDSAATTIGDILSGKRKRYRFSYQYDFGDGWDHEIMFEGCPSPEKGKKFPLCLEGGRSCPPEDIGGIFGYVDFLEAIADPKNERHEELLEWSGPFDSEKFDADEATKVMRQGLPNWRDYR